MTKPLSVDLRSRVIAAVEDGASHRQVGARFGVSAASVSRWLAQARIHGSVQAGRQGGDRRSHRIEAHKDLILAILADEPDITIEEMRKALAMKGHHFGYGSIQRFFVRHAITRKKRPGMRSSRTDLIS